MIRTQQALPSAGSLLSSQTDCSRISADSSSLECHQTTNLVLGRSQWPTYPGIRRKDLPFPAFCAAWSSIQGIESRTLRFSDLQITTHLTRRRRYSGPHQRKYLVRCLCGTSPDTLCQSVQNTLGQHS